MQSVEIHGNSISVTLLSERYQGQENANTAMLGALVTHSTLIAWFANAMRVWKVQYNSHSFTVSNAHRHSASSICVKLFGGTGALPTQCPDAKKNIYIYICMHSHTHTYTNYFFASARISLQCASIVSQAECGKSSTTPAHSL